MMAMNIPNIPEEQGPFITAALLCERVLIEQDGVKSAIRIVDRVVHQAIGPNPPEQMMPFHHSLTLLVSMKAGWHIRGSRNIEIRLVKPTGESDQFAKQTVFFEGEEDRGVDLLIQLVMNVERAGLYWFHVNFEGRTLARIPMRIIYAPQTIQLPPAGNNP